MIAEHYILDFGMQSKTNSPISAVDILKDMGQTIIN